MTAAAQSPRLETFTQWADASVETRRNALQPCLDHIRARDPSIHAWVQVLPQAPTADGPLSGIPFGAKDIVETRGLSTEYGSPIYKGRIGTTDAAIIDELRHQGAVLLGKTVTTPFAYFTPSITLNPRAAGHTPGGSSSGSAAAVAAGMVPFAVGTQTKGSVLRPASYCGVTGFKPSYGLLSTDGVLAFAKSLDTLGFFTHTPADMARLWTAMGHALGPDEDIAFGAPDPMPPLDPAMAAEFQRAVSTLRAAGVTVRSIDLAPMLASLDEASTTVMFYEGARFHEERFRQHGSTLGGLADMIREGLQIPVERYDEARRFIDRCRSKVVEHYRATPVILVPAATGPAPSGLKSTGDPRMNAPWTALGTPAVSIPMPASGKLPLGLQLTADHGQDGRVLRSAMRVYDVLTSD
jgi:Asp-tRNA(Asn)/Glu-tRNA(Gln) amidotransferase A subunit family amidase